MAINFPNNPTLNQTFIVGSTKYTWNGTSWDSSVSINGGGGITEEVDPVFTASPAEAILAQDITNWNAAFEWGDHSEAGYQPAGDYVELDEEGIIPTQYLPSYVDDVLEVASFSALPIPGEAHKIYVTIDTHKIYRWGGTEYVEIASSIALGETSETAYRGDRGKIAYDHSQIINGSNPHNTTFANIASKPTTLSGYGITDVYTKTEVDNIVGDINTILDDINGEVI